MLKTLFLQLRPFLPALVILGLGALALKALHQLTQGISYHDVLATVRHTPVKSLLLSALFTLLSFVALAGYDASGLAYLKTRLPLRVLGLGSFAGYALGNTVGMGVLTGGAVRLRVYGAAGMEPAQVAKLMAFISSGFGLGITGIGALGLLWGARPAASLLPLPVWALQAVALLGLAVLAAVLAACARGRPLHLFKRSIPLPGFGLALTQVLVSAADIVFAALALWALLPASHLDFGSFLAFYALAVALSIISHVPGGIGVFEAVMLLAFRDSLKTEQVAGALLLFRAIYYLAPLALAVLLLVLREWHAIAHSRARQRASELSPIFLAVATFSVGVMLLVSGVTPSTDEATELLALHIPLVFVEASHFLGSIVGLALLYVARGLMLRLDAAWWAAVLLGGISVIFALPKGIAIGEMAALTTLLLLLVAGREEFDRKASLFTHAFTLNWWLMVTAVLGAVTWLMFFVYRDVNYTDDLWWQFTFDGHAPRSLRAIFAVVLLTIGVGMRQAFRPASGVAIEPSEDDLARALAIVKSQGRADAMLVMLGDKSLLFSASGKSFLMFGKHKRTWAALYDPIGPEAEWPELIWRFVEHAHTNGGRACFYQASAKALALYVDVGLSAHKLGEYASVNLTTFALQGSKRQVLRSALNKGERDGLSFEVLPPEAVPALIPQLQAVSEVWLGEHATREKGFSLGSFVPEYLARMPLAVARKDGAVVAFANIMLTEVVGEATVDLMRYSPAAPKGVMDYLFVQLLLHFKALGHQRFGLGMAPLSGMSTHANAPHWQRLGRLIYRHGEHFYNFRGLRAFKEKFEPQWEARYLCAEGNVRPLLVFADIATLVSGGFRGVLAK